MRWFCSAPPGGERPWGLNPQVHPSFFIRAFFEAARTAGRSSGGEVWILCVLGIFSPFTFGIKRDGGKRNFYFAVTENVMKHLTCMYEVLRLNFQEERESMFPLAYTFLLQNMILRIVL